MKKITKQNYQDIFEGWKDGSIPRNEAYVYHHSYLSEYLLVQEAYNDYGLIIKIDDYIDWFKTVQFVNIID